MIIAFRIHKANRICSCFRQTEDAFFSHLLSIFNIPAEWNGLTVSFSSSSVCLSVCLSGYMLSACPYVSCWIICFLLNHMYSVCCLSGMLRSVGQPVAGCPAHASLPDTARIRAAVWPSDGPIGRQLTPLSSSVSLRRLSAPLSRAFGPRSSNYSPLLRTPK